MEFSVRTPRSPNRGEKKKAKYDWAGAIHFNIGIGRFGGRALSTVRDTLEIQRQVNRAVSEYMTLFGLHLLCIDLVVTKLYNKQATLQSYRFGGGVFP